MVSIPTGLTLLTSLLVSQAKPPVEPSGGIVAIVGDEVITKADLDRRCDMVRADLMGQYPIAVIDRELPRLQRQELERMIDDKLILQLVKKDEEKQGKPYVTEEDIDHAIEDRLAKLREEGMRISDPEELYAIHREKYGMKRDEFRSHLKKQIAVGRHLWQQVLKGNSKIVSPEEARCYYRSHIDEFSTPEKVSFRMIFINRDRLDAPMALEQVEKGIKAGTPFLELAQWSDEAVVEGNSKAAGRLWEKTFKDLKSWREPIPETLRKMKKGEISQRLDTAAGIHFLQVEEIVAGTPQTFQEAQPAIEKIIIAERNLRARDGFLSRLRKRTRIEILLPPPPGPGTPAIARKRAPDEVEPSPAAAPVEGRKDEKKEGQAE